MRRTTLVEACVIRTQPGASVLGVLEGLQEGTEGGSVCVGPLHIVVAVREGHVVPFNRECTEVVLGGQACLKGVQVWMGPGRPGRPPKGRTQPGEV